MSALPEQWREHMRRVLRRSRIYAAYVLMRDGFLGSTGWLRSFRTQVPVDANNEPLPWFTYAAIAFLEPRLKPTLTVFEWGCGYSTLWWAARVRSVVSYEHDLAWQEKMRSMAPQNVELHHVGLEGDGGYAHAVTRYREGFDIVVVDGRDRINCARHALDGLKSGGVIVFDNTDRAEYADAYQYLEARGMRRIDFYGPGPINPYMWCTSVFYRESNCLGI